MLAFQSRPCGAARRQSSSIDGSSRPRTLAIPLGVAFAAACISSPRRRTTLQPGLEVERAGEHQGRVLTQAQPRRPGARRRRPRAACAFRSSRAARLATKIAGWLTSVASSASAGPSRQTARRSKPRISSAWSNNARAAGSSLVQGAAHPDGLRPLAREQEGDLRHDVLVLAIPAETRSGQIHSTRRPAASCSTISWLSRSSAIVPATRSAFLIARAPEEPWQMMQAPRMPSNGPPPNSWYSNRVLRSFRPPAIALPASAGQARQEPRQLLLEGREEELHRPLARLQEHIADEPLADDDPGVPFVDVAALDVADEPVGQRAVLEQGAGRPGQVGSFLFLGADVQQADRGVGDLRGSSRRKSPP